MVSFRHFETSEVAEMICLPYVKGDKLLPYIRDVACLVSGIIDCMSIMAYGRQEYYHRLRLPLKMLFLMMVVVPNLLRNKFSIK
jgi:hypothetical protein